MKNIILHIGMHKTGSSSIQAALNGFDDGNSKYADLGVENHSIPFYTAFSKHYLNYHIWTRRGFTKSTIQEKREYYFNKIVKTLQQNTHNSLIFSGEDISYLLEDEIIVIRNLLKKYSDEVYVYAYFRHPVNFVQSATAQLIKDGNNKLHQLRYKNLFEKFINVFGESYVKLRFYDKKMLIDGDVTKDFFGWLEASLPKSVTKSENVSPSTAAIKCIYLLNKSNPLTKGDTLLSRARSDFIDILEEVFPGTLEIPSNIIHDALDMGDVSWMENISGVKFNLEPSNKPIQYTSLDEFMSDISDGVVDVLIDYLKGEKVYEDFDREPIKLMNRIYYLCLCNNTLKVKDFQFSAERYLELNPDVKAAGSNPYIHFLLHGMKEGRKF